MFSDHVCVLSRSVVFDCDPMDCSLPDSSVHEDSPGLPCLPPGDLPNPGIKPRSTSLQVDSLSEPRGKPTLTMMDLNWKLIEEEQLETLGN